MGGGEGAISVASRAVRGDFGVFDFLIRCCTEERLEFDRAVIWMDGWYTGGLYRGRLKST